MKKKFFVSLLLALSLCLGFCVSASASAIGYVSDAAGILSQQESLNLSQNAQTVSEYYGCGVYIVVVDDYQNYVRGDMADFSEAVYKEYALGLGDGRDGIVLALSMADRDYDLCAYGDFANYAFTDYGKDKLAEAFLDNFRNNDWAGGFNDYVAFCSGLLDLAKNGNPLDTMVYETEPEKPGWDGFELMLILLVPSLIALAVCGIFAAQMKTTGRQSYANAYLDSSAVNLTARSDHFLYRNSVRTKVRQDDDGPRAGGGRPGGTTINAGGFSHKSGKF